MNASSNKDNPAYLEVFLPNNNEKEAKKQESTTNLPEGEDIAIKKINDLVENKFLLRIVKTIVLFIMMGGITIGRFYGLPDNPVECLNDPLHNAFGYFNNLVNTNVYYASFFQISSSFLMDFTFFVVYVYWVFYAKSCRLVLTCILFYSLRAFCQFLVQMRFPPGYYWDDPGFPSLVVPYGNTTDFFYSGHVGFLNIAALEWHKQKMYKMTYLTIAIIFYMIFVLLIFRGHYSIDMITGLVFSNWIFTHIDLNEKYLNQIFLRTYRKILKFFVFGKCSNTKKREI